MARNDNSTATTIATFGGSAALAWFLLRHTFGGGGGGGTSGNGGTAPPNSPTAPSSPPPCRVFIREHAIELNGAPADLATVVATCRTAGAADLGATGAAIVRVIAETGRALQRAGVRVNTPPNLRRYIDDAIAP